MTNRRWDTPTCTAARPTPGAEYIVSNMSLTSFFRLSSNSVTGSPGLSSIGFGHFTTSLNAIFSSHPSAQLPSELILRRTTLEALATELSRRNASPANSHATALGMLQSSGAFRPGCRRQTFRAWRKPEQARPLLRRLLLRLVRL